MAQDRRDGYHTVALIYQHQVHQQPGGAPVAILEGVDIHQPPVCVSRQQDRVGGLLPLVQILYQLGHLAGDLLRRGRDILGACDKHLPLPVAPGVLRVNTAIEQGVEAEDIFLAELQGAAPGGLQHIVIGPGVSRGLIAVPDGFPAHRDPVLQKHFCLGEGQGVALQGVGGVGGADPEIVIQFFYFIRRQGAPLPDSLGIYVDFI